MRLPYPALTVLALLAALVLAAGCGGGDDDQTDATAAAGGDASNGVETASNTETLPKQQYIRRANAVCRKAGVQIQREFRPYLEDGLESLPQAAPAMVNDVLIPGLETEIEELRAIGLPDEGAEEVDAMITALEEGMERATEDPEDFVLRSSGFQESEQLGRKFGSSACGGL
jgi:hypothetical protein